MSDPIVYTVKKGSDSMTITILPDGRIKTETDAVSLPNHQSADQFLAEVAKLAGGPVEIDQRKKATHTHAHTDQHAHQH